LHGGGASIDFCELAGLELAGGAGASRSRFAGASGAEGAGGGVGGASLPVGPLQEQPLGNGADGGQGHALQDLWFTLAALPLDKEVAAAVR
jgi:hypothetical protein